MTADFSPRRVVVLAPNWLGDVVMALPAIGAVRAWWPSASLAVAARTSVAPILTLVDGIDEVVPLEGRGGWRDVAVLARDARRLAAAACDLALLLPNSLHAALLAWRAGIPQRWGYRADVRTWLLTRAPRKPRVRMHQAEYYRALVRALGGPELPLVAALRTTHDLRQRAERLLHQHGWRGGQVVTFAPGAAFGLAKRWPPERVAQVAARLALERDVTPVWVGVQGDRDTIARVQSAYTEILGPDHATTAIDLAGRTDLLALAGVLSLSAAVVSNDSGAMHVAAAVGVPVTGIFGPTDERATTPLPHPSGRGAVAIAGKAWCRPCQLRACPLDHRCMTSIDPGQVVDAVAVHLGRVRVPGGHA